MTPFKPAEIRVIVVLSALALAGSILNLLKREGKINSLDLGIFTEKKYYNYEYKIPRSQSGDIAVSPDDAIATVENIPVDAAIDINAAGIYDLQTLPGIGPAIAERIVAFRDSVGKFERVEDLLLVKGIGPAKLDLLKNRVKVR